MDSVFKKLIDSYDRIIAILEGKNKLQEDVIQTQKVLIAGLEKKNALLEEWIEKNLNPPQKGTHDE